MKRARIGLTGPLAVHVTGFQAELRQLGYTASPAKKHHYLLAHLSRWLDEHGLEVVDVATSRVEPFFAARRAAGVANLRTRGRAQTAGRISARDGRGGRRRASGADQRGRADHPRLPQLPEQRARAGRGHGAVLRSHRRPARRRVLRRWRCGLVRV